MSGAAYKKLETDYLLADVNDEGPGLQSHGPSEGFTTIGTPTDARRTRKLVDRLTRFTTLAGTITDDAQDVDPKLGQGALTSKVVANVMGAGSVDHESQIGVEREVKLASPAKTAITIFKSMVGTGILFLPRAFYSSGWLAGTITLVLSGVVSMYSMILLLRAKQGAIEQGRMTFSYGDLGTVVAGKPGKRMVHGTIILSQLGFVCVYFVFIASNVSVILEAVWGVVVTKENMVLLLAVFLSPFAFLHSLRALHWPNMIANVLMLSTLTVLYVTNFEALFNPPDCSGLEEAVCATTTSCKFVAECVASRGEVARYNPNQYFMFLGTAIYIFEGVAMVIPIQNAAADKKGFSRLLMIIVAAVVLLVTSFGLVGYLAFGEDTQKIVLDNVDNSRWLATILSALYILVALASPPLYIFPIVRIVHRYLNKKVYNGRVSRFMSNTVIRVVLILMSMAISYGCVNNIDNLVAIIGGTCCVPLTLIFPPVFHAKICRPSTFHLIIDYGMCLMGVVCAVLSTYEAVMNWGD